MYKVVANRVFFASSPRGANLSRKSQRDSRVSDVSLMQASGAQNAEPRRGGRKREVSFKLRQHSEEIPLDKTFPTAKNIKRAAKDAQEVRNVRRRAQQTAAAPSDQQPPSHNQSKTAAAAPPSEPGPGVTSNSLHSSSFQAKATEQAAPSGGSHEQIPLKNAGPAADGAQDLPERAATQGKSKDANLAVVDRSVDHQILEAGASSQDLARSSCFHGILQGAAVSMAKDGLAV